MEYVPARFAAALDDARVCIALRAVVQELIMRAVDLDQHADGAAGAGLAGAKLKRGRIKGVVIVVGVAAAFSAQTNAIATLASVLAGCIAEPAADEAVFVREARSVERTQVDPVLVADENLKAQVFPRFFRKFNFFCQRTFS